MNHTWYWKRQDELYGPLTTTELEDLVHRNRIADADEIRVDGADDWLPAAEIKAMFTAPVENGGATAADAASRVLSRASRMQLEREAEGASRAGWVGNRLGDAGRALAAPFAGVWDWLLERLEPFLDWHGLLNRKAMVAVLTLLFFAIVFQSAFTGPNPRQVHERLAGTFEALQVLDQRGAPEGEYRQLESETNAWLAPAIADLEAAGEPHPLWSWTYWSKDTEAVRRSLISAGKTLQNYLKEGSPGERYAAPFQRSMEVVAGYLSGEMSSRKFATRAREQRAQRQAQQGGTQGASSDPLFVGMILVDGVAVLGGLAYWWKSRR